uniref:J domain-containing protein n=1 Tax=viral metagenome TaxID=1070528 RepID=A0A6C0J897_9ZZZZ
MDINSCMSFMQLEPTFIEHTQSKQIEILEQKYIILCKKYHPDSKEYKTGADNTEQFIKLQEAYDTLVNYISYYQQTEDPYIECTLNDLYSGCKKTVYHNLSNEKCTGQVNIPAGTMPGQVILVDMFNNIGTHINVCPVTIIEVNNTLFSRVNCNLFLTLNISLYQALFGNTIKVALLGQNVVDIPVNIGASDEKHVLVGHGMPVLNNYGVYGDLIVNYRIVFPIKPDDILENALYKFD